MPILIASTSPAMDGHPCCCIPERPVARGGCVSCSACGNCANTAVPDPVMRPCKPWSCNQLDAAPHIGTQRLRHRLKIVVSEFQDFLEIDHPNCLDIFSRVVCSKALDYSSFCVPFEIWRAKDALRGRAARWFDHHKTRSGQAHGCELLAHAFDPGVAPADEERHVGAQGEPDRRELRSRQAQPPEAVERQQGGGGVGRAAAHAGFGWQVLFQRDVHAQGAAGGALQRPGSAHRQVFGWQRTWREVFAADAAVRAPVRSADGRTSRSA